MKIAHTVDGSVAAVYEFGSQPTSFKGKMVPVVEAKRPEDRAGSAWDKALVVFEDRVEIRWEERPLSADELSAIAVAEENSRIRGLMDALRAGQGTAAERLARLERVVAHLVKLEIGA